MNFCLYRGILAAILILALSHCSQRKPIDINDDVRDPSDHSSSVIQIAPMVPEAVQLLIKEADEQIEQGLIKAAVLTLSRALSISPTSATVHQHLAEVYLSEGNYQAAFNWSNRVVQDGPAHGPICERARRTLALAAEMLNDVETQAAALEAIDSCSQSSAPRY
ncbi:tetratricopeptide repeat protein [Marinicella litoralis]|uniref:Uncharacterized protein n=1 Tax=Marinicella litoralis TaxID=644220 RepID=A0A4R6XZJ2_9GAMM|nr:hypothetical protein [Marinicella litoralis]TDR23764.1 hypothetical protein C8D91_0630 [Marinicella litoralis]